MSNCITLDNDLVTFSRDELDIPALSALLDTVADSCRALDEYYYLDDRDKINIYYYFKANTFFNDDGTCTIAFGSGRSGHTNRSFRFVLGWLHRFVLRPKQHTFSIRDEYDGYRSVEHRTVDFFSPNPVVVRFKAGTVSDK